MFTRRFGRRALAAIPLVVVTVALVLGHAGIDTTSRATAQAPVGTPRPQTDDSLPAEDVTMFGAAPSEASDETWGLGKRGGAATLVRYTSETGWSLGPALLDAEGNPLKGFALDNSEAAKHANPNPLAGDMTATGDGVLVGNVTNVAGGTTTTHQVVLVRNPGGAFQETAAVPSEGAGALLESGEHLFGSTRSPLIAAVGEAGGKAGVLVAPANESASVEKWVLHWNGTSWAREPIAIPEKNVSQFEVLAIGASSPENAWLIARLQGEGYPSGSVALFRRVAGVGAEPPTWQPVTMKHGGEPGEPLAVELTSGSSVGFNVPSSDQAQLLNVTSEGLWIDGERRDAALSTSLFLQPEGETGAHAVASWCQEPTGKEQPCRYVLPEALPTRLSRSFAWANASTPERLGERVITGFGDGVSWRLEGVQFKRLLALGGTDAPEADVGGSYGAAFSSASEGWLGQRELPVHLTLNPQTSRLTSWPVSFRYPLLALASQPGAPVGALSSQALAVGGEGEVARYLPGKGWLPESLLGPGGRKTPLLRAVAWPTATRAYAVGDLGEMWLWRGETGLWEPDPATPINFRGNLLGIAFDPNEASRGYAVGQDGVLLRFGKTWTQEPTCEAEPQQPCLPPEVAGASFTSVAFAGSEALVAYRKLVAVGKNEYKAGILVNEGSGWHVDGAAATAIGSDVPWAVAGLPDGGAAFTAAGTGEDEHFVFEREAAGSAWQAVAVPGLGAPGSLNVFREGGALRTIVLGREPLTFEDESSPPPGSPPLLAPPYPVISSLQAGVLRQTSTGWIDELHELNNALEPPGEYAEYDGVYQPDPVAALLVGASGEPGWAVGGRSERVSPNLLDTADVWRYREDATPIGESPAPVTAASSEATFAIGGNAQCAAPCSDRAEARIGPDVWLSNALSTAESIPNLSAFIYTGPRVTTGQTVGAAVQAVPYEQELQRYASVLGGRKMPVYVAASPTDLDAGSESEFESAFEGFPQPFAKGACGGSTCGLAYAVTRGPVRLIVLDNTGDVEEQQLIWLKEQLGAAKGHQPAIVVGNADLQTQIAAGDTDAKELKEVLIFGEASAYFFDSPEQNLKVPLRPASSGVPEIPSFGSGTLGYIDVAPEKNLDFLGASGFLLVHVAKAPEATSSVYRVTAKLIPDIGELAIEAESGTLLNRSQAALFKALARRPRAGSRLHKDANERSVHPDPIQLRWLGMRQGSRNGIQLQLVQRKDWGVRQALPRGQRKHGVPQRQGRARTRLYVWALLRSEPRHHHGDDHRRRHVRVAAGDRPGRECPPAVRDYAGDESGEQGPGLRGGAAAAGANSNWSSAGLLRAADPAGAACAGGCARAAPSPDAEPTSVLHLACARGPRARVRAAAAACASQSDTTEWNLGCHIARGGRATRRGARERS
jgi:hypothetical protein